MLKCRSSEEALWELDSPCRPKGTERTRGNKRNRRQEQQAAFLLCLYPPPHHLLFLLLSLRRRGVWWRWGGGVGGVGWRASERKKESEERRELAGERVSEVVVQRLSASKCLTYNILDAEEIMSSRPPKKKKNETQWLIFLFDCFSRGCPACLPALQRALGGSQRLFCHPALTLLSWARLKVPQPGRITKRGVLGGGDSVSAHRPLRSRQTGTLERLSHLHLPWPGTGGTGGTGGWVGGRGRRPSCHGSCTSV